MKATNLIILAFAAGISISAAEDKTPSKTITGEKPKSMLQKAEDGTVAAGHAVVTETKKAGRAIENAVMPDKDATKVEVSLSDKGITMPSKLSAGKTAFLVKNTGKEKHNFHIKGQGVDEKFFMDVASNDTKIMHVQLKPGTYEVTCPEKEKQGDAMKHTLTVH